jgi:maleylacetoacetate isomerase
MKLYSYWRSSAAYRVRIGLNVKGLAHTIEPVSLLAGGGEQHRAAYRELQPQGLVPVLVEEDGGVLFQSLAILEYLEECWPEPPLLPRGARDRAFVRAFALALACEVHPLNNLRVLRYLAEDLGADEEARTRWIRHWISLGFEACEAMLVRRGAGERFVFGDGPSLAEICLVPQMYNARRYGCDLSPYPRLRAADEAARVLPAFLAAAPERQADAPVEAGT